MKSFLFRELKDEFVLYVLNVLQRDQQKPILNLYLGQVQVESQFFGAPMQDFDGVHGPVKGQQLVRSAASHLDFFEGSVGLLLELVLDVGFGGLLGLDALDREVRDLVNVFFCEFSFVRELGDGIGAFGSRDLLHHVLVLDHDSEEFLLSHLLVE